jgi:hypothetical protein
MNRMLSNARHPLDALPLLRRVGTLIGLVGLVLLPWAGAGLVWAVTHAIGAGLSPDSINYLYMAQKVVAGNGFVTIDPTLVPSWSPGYPLFLAFIAFLTGSDPFQFAHVVNMILFAATIFLAGYLGWRTIGVWSPMLWLVLGIVAFSNDLLAIFAMAWSEPLFIVMSLLLFIAIQKYVIHSNRRNLIILAVLGAGVCLVRYSGLVVVPVVVLSILLWSQGTGATRLRHGIIFAVGSTVPLLFWMFRNFMTTDTLMGARYPSQMPLMTNIRLSAETVLAWYMDDRVVATAPFLEIVAFIGGMALLGFGFVWWRNAPHAKQFLRQNGVMVLFSLAYTIFIIASATQVHVDPIGQRLLAPVFIPLTLCLFALAQAVIYALPYRVLQVGFVILAGGIGFAVVGQQIMETQFYVMTHRDEGVEGISHVQWEDSETLASLEQMKLPESATVYSPYLELLYYRTGRIGTPVPRRGTLLDELKGEWPPTPGYLIWFEGAEYSFPSIEELRQIAILTEIERYEDGATFRIERKLP